MENQNKNSSGLGLLYKIFNIYPHEISRVTACWSIRFVYRMAFVLSWTVILSIFMGKFGVIGLPYFFIFHAFLFIMGSLIYMHLIQKYHLDKVILFIIFSAILMIGGAIFSLKFSINLYLFLMLFAEAFFLIHLTVAFDTFNERFFTPFESQRTFPLVESADTVASIISGLIFIIFSRILPIYSFTWIILAFTFFIVPMVLYFRFFVKTIPNIKLFSHNEGKHTLTKNIKNGVKLFQQHAFAKNLIYIILLQYAFLVLIEFIYTGAVANFSMNYAAFPEAAMGIENAYANTFGFLQLIIGIASLLMQISIGGRIIGFIGIIGSMILYPAVMLLNLAGLIMRPGFYSAVLSKISSEITSVVSRNSYQSSYYAFREEESEEIRQMIDGMIRPLGTMTGATLLLFTQFFVSHTFLNLTIICIMFVIIMIDFIVISKTHALYTNNAVATLLCKTESIDERLKSVDILMQRGHGEVAPVLIKCLNNPDEHDLLKIKVLNAIAEIKYFDGLPEVINFIFYPKKEIRIAAIEAIKAFQSAGYFKNNEFSKLKTIETFKSAFWKEPDEEIRIMILNAIVSFGGHTITDFIVDILQNETGTALAGAIRSLRNLHDISLGELLEPYLESQDSRLVYSAAIALWQFPKYRPQIKKIIGTMLKSNKKLKKIYSIYAIGEIRVEDFKEKLFSIFVKEKDEEIKIHIAIALLKFGIKSYIKFIVEIIKNHSHPLSYHTIRLLNEIPEQYKPMINNDIYLAASYEIHEIFRNGRYHSFNDISKEKLLELRYYYNLLNSTSDVLKIDAILKKRKLS